MSGLPPDRLPLSYSRYLAGRALLLLVQGKSLPPDEDREWRPGTLQPGPGGAFGIRPESFIEAYKGFKNAAGDHSISCKKMPILVFKSRFINGL